MTHYSRFCYRGSNRRLGLWLGLFCLLLCACLPSPPALAAEGGSLYITTTGESIEQIAQACYLDAELLAAINNLSPDQALAAGTLLYIPQAEVRAITIKPGDTLWSLARTYQLSVAEIAELNSLIVGETIYSGQTLYLPLAEEEAAIAGAAPDYESNEAVLALASRYTGGFAWPLEGVITSRFGARSRDYHYGLDIAADQGTPVLAAASGYVVAAGWQGDSYGYAVMIEHDARYTTLYAHHSQVLVDEGDFVIQGQPIALVGSTGNSTGPHVHFEVRLNGTRVDPLDYLP